MSSFKDQVILITGAGSGIGRAAAISFAKDGASLILSDIKQDGLEETGKLVEEAGGKVSLHVCNVAKAAEVADMVAQGVKAFGRLDVALNNAGIGAPHMPSAQLPHEAWDLVIAVNQSGVFYCMQSELQVMQEQGSGTILNVASIAGLKGFPMQMAYAASKHAVVGMTKSAALEYAKMGIRVNALCPVFTDTPMVDLLKEVAPNMGQKLTRGIPMRRLGTTEDMVKAIRFLCSDEASFTTGLALPVDGGTMA